MFGKSKPKKEIKETKKVEPKKKQFTLKKNMNPKYVKGSVMSQEDYDDYKSRGLNVDEYLK